MLILCNETLQLEVGKWSDLRIYLNEPEMAAFPVLKTELTTPPVLTLIGRGFSFVRETDEGYRQVCFVVLQHQPDSEFLGPIG